MNYAFYLYLLISFICIIQPQEKSLILLENLQCARIDWSSPGQLHTTLAYFEGGHKQQLEKALEKLKNNHALSFEYNLPVKAVDILTRFKYSRHPLLQFNNPNISNDDRFAVVLHARDNYPPSQEDPWFLVIHYETRNNPFNDIKSFFPLPKSNQDTYFGHITIGKIREVYDIELLFNVLKEANEKFRNYLKDHNPYLRIDALHLKLLHNPKDSVLIATIGRKSKVIESIDELRSTIIQEDHLLGSHQKDPLTSEQDNFFSRIYKKVAYFLGF